MNTQFAFYTDKAKYYAQHFRQGKELIKKYYIPILREIQAKKILDIGCGPGIAKVLVDEGFSVIGVDQSPTFVDMANKHFPAVIDDMRTLGHVRTKFSERIPFDAAIAVFTTLPHLENPQDIIQHFIAVRKTARYYVFDFPAYINLIVSEKYEFDNEKYVFDRVGRVIMELTVEGETYQIPQALITPLFVDAIAPLTGWRVVKRLVDGREFKAKEKILTEARRFVYVLERKDNINIKKFM